MHRQQTTNRRRGRRFAALVLCLAIPLAACASDDDGVGADAGQPQAGGGFADNNAPAANGESPGNSSPAAKGLDSAVPVPNDATSSGAATTVGTTTTQSFLVDGVTAQQMIGDYQTLAEGSGWTAQAAPTQAGSDWTLTMTNGTKTLVVTATPANDNNQSDQTELSLQVTVPA
jgi:hypothetical protein